MNATTNTDLKTLAECMNHLKENGYKKDFQISAGRLKAMDDTKTYGPHEIKIDNFYRFEGSSDPADMAILYAIQTNDGEKGTLSDAYGPYASGRVTDFIQQVEDIHKKTVSRPW